MSNRTAIVAFAVAVAFLSGRCDRVRSRANSRTPCIADSISTLYLLRSLPSCANDDLLCRAQCIAGRAESCLGLAYEAEKDPQKRAEALRFYRSACLRGAALGCTNYAATVWARDLSADELTCVRRTFEKACAAREPFACGMVGRVMLESATAPSYAQGRKYLEKACDDVGGFPCRVLAKHLESGKLGDYEPGLIRSLLERACAGGDPDGCGEPATAAETFQ